MLETNCTKWILDGSFIEWALRALLLTKRCNRGFFSPFNEQRGLLLCFCMKSFLQNLRGLRTFSIFSLMTWCFNGALWLTVFYIIEWWCKREFWSWWKVFNWEVVRTESMTSALRSFRIEFESPTLNIFPAAFSDLIDLVWQTITNKICLNLRRRITNSIERLIFSACLLLFKSFYHKFTKRSLRKLNTSRNVALWVA